MIDYEAGLIVLMFFAVAILVAAVLGYLIAKAVTAKLFRSCKDCAEDATAFRDIVWWDLSFLLFGIFNLSILQLSDLLWLRLLGLFPLILIILTGARLCVVIHMMKQKLSRNKTIEGRGAL